MSPFSFPNLLIVIVVSMTVSFTVVFTVRGVQRLIADYRLRAKHIEMLQHHVSYLQQIVDRDQKQIHMLQDDRKSLHEALYASLATEQETTPVFDRMAVRFALSRRITS